MMEEPVEEIDDTDPEPVSGGLIGLLGNNIQVYGWFILAAVCLTFYLIKRHNSSRQNVANENREGLIYDSETALKRQEAMDAHRKKLQEQHDARAAKFAEEQRIKDESKRQALIEDWDRHQRGDGYRSKSGKRPEDGNESTASASSNKPKPSKPLRSSDFNPLAGSSTDRVCYRPSRGLGPSGGG